MVCAIVAIALPPGKGCLAPDAATSRAFLHDHRLMGSEAALLCLRFVARDGLLRPYETGIRPLEVAVALRALHLPTFAHVLPPMALQSAIEGAVPPAGKKQGRGRLARAAGAPCSS